MLSLEDLLDFLLGSEDTVKVENDGQKVQVKRCDVSNQHGESFSTRTSGQEGGARR